MDRGILAGRIIYELTIKSETTCVIKYIAWYHISRKAGVVNFRYLSGQMETFSALQAICAGN